MSMIIAPAMPNKHGGLWIGAYRRPVELHEHLISSERLRDVFFLGLGRREKSWL